MLGEDFYLPISDVILIGVVNHDIFRPIKLIVISHVTI
jgi:hypothetical protein